VPIIPATQEVEVGRLQSRWAPGEENWRPYLKNIYKEFGVVDQEVVWKYEVLSSNPSTAKKKNHKTPQ
jgi:hypothetical protein